MLINISAEAFACTSQKLVDMELPKQIDLFKISRTLLQFLGETYSNPPKYIIFFRIFNTIVMIYTSILITANFFHVSGGNHVETMQGLILVTHVRYDITLFIKISRNVSKSFQTLLKYLLYIYFKPGIEELLQNKFEEFWKYQPIDNDIIATIMKFYKTTELVQVSVLLATIITGILYLFKPILTKNSPFPFEAWVSGIIFLDVSTLASLYYFYCIVIPIVIGYDTVYLCLCIRTVGQVQLLKNRMRCFRRIVDASYYVRCHQFLLK